jgi:two-component system response regulator CpxR
MKQEREKMETTKILIVDDNLDLASIIHEMLEAEGYKVELAGDGQKGYFSYLLFRPDLVITDIQMPVKNGIELGQNIRVHNPEAKIIYMSGDLGSYMELLNPEKERYQAGLIEKPFSKKELMHLVSQLLTDDADRSRPGHADPKDAHPRDNDLHWWDCPSQSMGHHI